MPETTTNQEVTLIGAEWDGGSVIFQSKEPLKRLRVDDYKSYGTLGNPMDMCDGKTVCTPPDQKRRRLKKQSRHKLVDFQNSFFISIALKHRTCQMAGVS